jgi:hypothetical protein
MKPTNDKKHNRNKRTPQEVIDAFFNAHTPSEVEELLWETFRGYAVNGPKEPDGTSVKETTIAALFDDLNDLVSAAQALKEAG